MFRTSAIVLASLVFAAAVLGTSIFRTAAPNYAFSQNGNGQILGETATASGVKYYLPYPGILPDHFLWPVKAFRDKVWLLVTRDTMKRAELLLTFSDKRVGMAKALIEGGKADIGVLAAEKSGMYLDEAFAEQEKALAEGVDTASFLNTIARASLKHQEVLEAVMVAAPEDAKPILNTAIDSPKMVYEKAVQQLNKEGRPIPTMMDEEESMEDEKAMDDDSMMDKDEDSMEKSSQ